MFQSFAEIFPKVNFRWKIDLGFFVASLLVPPRGLDRRAEVLACRYVDKVLAFAKTLVIAQKAIQLLPVGLVRLGVL